MPKVVKKAKEETVQGREHEGMENGQAENPPSPKPTAKEGKGKKPKPVVKDILYPSEEERAKGILYTAEMCYGPGALTVDQSKALLGWREVEAKEGALFRDRHGKFIVCDNDTTNREIVWSKVEELVQTHLSRRNDGTPCWEFNGEPILVGKYGSILNGQKSLISHVLAEQDRLSDIEDPKSSPYQGRLKKLWPEPIVMEKMVIFGISEDDHVVNTLDTAQPRTLSDVMYRSEYLRSMSRETRSAASKIAGYAINVVWARTGAGDLAFMPRKTHDAATEFLERHKRILNAVKWMAEENADKVEYTNSEGTVIKVGRVQRFIEASRAAALLYLMAASGTDPAKYMKGKPPSEKQADFSRWEKAEEFWTLLVGDSPGFEPVRVALARLANTDTGRKPTPDEKIIVLCKAWKAFVAGEEFKPAALKPKYIVHKDPDGNITDSELVNDWCFDGIDVYTALEEEKEKEREARRLEREAQRQARLESEETEEEEEDGSEDDEGEGEEDVTEDEVIQDPTPEEIARIKRANRAREDETPEEERARREAIENGRK